MAKGYVYTTDVIQSAKDQFINEVRKALTDYDPATDNSQALAASIGAMLIYMDHLIKELGKDDGEGQ